jgi:glycosyltransferase involved in cell wall biosynthesis
MRVLHLSKTSDGAFWAARQVTELVQSGVEVHVALPCHSGAAVPTWERSGATIHWLDCSLPIRKPSTTLEVARAVRSLVTKTQPDLIHSHFVSTTLMLRMALGRNHPIPRVFQVPGPLHLEHWYTRKMDLVTSGERDFWIASSQFTLGRYESAGICHARRFLSYYGAETNLFSQQHKGYLRKRFNIPVSAFVVGNINLIYPPKRYLGQRVGLKCHEDVIHAIASVQKERSNVWGVLIGGTFGSDQHYETKLRTLAEQKGLGRILTPGKFTSGEVAQSWPDFDCAVHVPFSENCGGVVEPLLCHIPTIASTVGGLTEVVHNGKTGTLVPVHRSDLLAQEVMNVMDRPDQYRQYARRGGALVSEMFDSKRCGKEILDIYRHILYHDPRPDEFTPEQFLNSKQDDRDSVPCDVAMAVAQQSE